MNMVDPQEGETSSSKSLVERLEETPRNIVDYLTATSKNYLSHMLAIVKPYWPQHNLAPIALGIAADCQIKISFAIVKKQKKLLRRS